METPFGVGVGVGGSATMCDTCQNDMLRAKVWLHSTVFTDTFSVFEFTRVMLWLAYIEVNPLQRHCAARLYSAKFKFKLINKHFFF